MEEFVREYSENTNTIFGKYWLRKGFTVAPSKDGSMSFIIDQDESWSDPQFTHFVLDKDSTVELAMKLLKFGGPVGNRDAFETLIAENRKKVQIYTALNQTTEGHFKRVYLGLAEAHEKTAELLEALIWEPDGNEL